MVHPRNTNSVAWGKLWFGPRRLEYKKSLVVTGAITRPILGTEYQVMVVGVTYH